MQSYENRAEWQNIFPPARTLTPEQAKQRSFFSPFKKKKNYICNSLSYNPQALRQKDAEVDELRRQASLKAHENMDLIADLKAQMLAMRKAVKAHYPQYEWIKYGVQDKR